MECAVAGTAWLLQFIEDLQQSREFHKTCELELPNEAATIPEVLFLPIYSDFTSSYHYNQPCTVAHCYAQNQSSR